MSSSPTTRGPAAVVEGCVVASSTSPLDGVTARALRIDDRVDPAASPPGEDNLSETGAGARERLKWSWCQPSPRFSDNDLNPVPRFDRER